MVVHPEHDERRESHERRSGTRYPFFREINIVAAGEMVSGSAADLSAEGIRLRLPTRPAPGTPLAILTPIRPRGMKSGLTVAGIVVWRRGQDCGVRFVEPTQAFDTTVRQLLSQYLLHANADEVAAFIRTRSRETTAH